MSLLKRLALATGRAAEDLQALSSQRVSSALRLLYTAILGALLLLLVPVFVQQFTKWSRFTPTVPFWPGIWRVVVDPGQHVCGFSTDHDPDCLANPANPALWRSPFQRDDERHVARVTARGAQPYWLGASIPVPVLREARSRQANLLLLGWILSDYRIWVDGRLVLAGAGNKDSNPVLLPVPMSRLYEPHALRIAIEVAHDSDFSQPDYLNRLRGGEGFVTSGTASTFRDFVTFWGTVRPFALLIAYMVIASLFFSFWLSAREKSEHFYMALFALASACYQARMTSLFMASVSRDMATDMDVVLRFYVAAFGMALGLAFARARLSYFKYGMPLCLVFPFTLLCFLRDSHAKTLVSTFIQEWATPAFYVFGGAICALQAYHLFTERKGKPWLSGRALRLSLFALGLAALSGFYIAQSVGWVPPMLRMVWMGLGFEHFVFVVLFGTIVLRESRPGPAPLFALQPAFDTQTDSERNHGDGKENTQS